MSMALLGGNAFAIWGSASLILHRRRCDEDGFVGAVHGARASFKLISIFVGVFFYT